MSKYPLGERQIGFATIAPRPRNVCIKGVRFEKTLGNGFNNECKKRGLTNLVPWKAMKLSLPIAGTASNPQ
jgi:hypothetical protein